MDLFTESPSLRSSDLADRREALLAADLDRALFRIAALETEAAAQRTAFDGLERELSATLRQIGAILGARDELSRFPAAAQAALLDRLTIVQRRDAWLGILSHCVQTGPLFGLAPHGGGDDPLSILLVGTGGIGDALYLSTVARALHRAFPAPRVVVLHDHDAAGTVFAGNPYVLETLVMRGETREEFLDHCHALDVFDLIADVRYAVSYATPPRSRIPQGFLRAAHARAAPWQRYVRFDWPHRNNTLAREAARQGMSKLDLLGFTANLDVDHDLPPDFFAPMAGEDPLGALAGRGYVTVHHGAAANMGGADGLQTKNLPIERWAEIVAGLVAAGHAVVQLGAEQEHLIPDVTLDLRGRTDLPMTARALQHASLHLDTEGGLVHLARARLTPSVVMFGPTPPTFFGYPGNANLAPQECGDCWWTARDWSARCPLGEDRPPCMASHDAATVLAAAARLARKPLRLEFGTPAPVAPPSADPLASMAAAAAAELAGTQGGGLYVDDLDLFVACLAEPRLASVAPRFLVPAELRAAAQDVAAGRAEALPIAPGFIPLAAGSLPAAVAALAWAWEAPAWLGLAAELGRIAAPGAPAALLSRYASPPLPELRTAADGMPGDLVRFVLPGSLDVTGPWRIGLHVALARSQPAAAA